VKVPAVLLMLGLSAAGLTIFQQAGAQQSSPPLGARLKMRWGRTTVTLTEGTQSHEIPIREHFEAARLEKVTLESAKEGNGFIYLLLDVTGPSKDPPDAHHCGGGSESDLIWLKLDKDWKPVSAQSFQYDSCWMTIMTNDGPSWKADTLIVSADQIKDGGSTVTRVARYTYKHPEDGIKVTETPAGN
jgi:hypothetical protein